MSEPDYGVAIDTSTDTVFLVGADFIRMLVGAQGQGQTLKDFNRIAVEILKLHGPAYGVDLENTDFDNWCLATTTEEDAVVLLSYLEDPRAEVAFSLTKETLAPEEPAKPVLH